MSKKKRKLTEVTPTVKSKLIPSTTGQVVRLSNGGDFVFRADNGVLVDIPQSTLTQRLFDAHEKCVIDFSDESKTSGVIIKNLGKAGDPIPEGLAIAERYRVTTPFPDDAKWQAQLASKQRVSSDGIMDYTSIPFFTIDPTNSKDFDDAIYVEKHDDGSFTLYVGIANVGKYVSAGSPLFKDALNRGNSTYLGEQVYPMLPEDLSNDACSLNEKTDKYATVTTINYSPSGNITSYEIGLGVINSRKRLTYAQAQDIHDCKNGAHIEFIDQKKAIDIAYELSTLRKGKRTERGAFDINEREPEFILDETKTKVEEIRLGHQETSTFVIESFMIDANDVWGDFSERSRTPFVYRCHDPLTRDNETMLRSKLSPFGLHLPKNPTGLDLQRVLAQVKKTSLKEPVTAYILRSLRHAYYSTSNNGHLGLGINNVQKYLEEKLAKQSAESFLSTSREAYFSKYGIQCGVCADYIEGKANSYGHTTSPIRRGADLLNQIQFSSVFTNGSPAFTTEAMSSFCENLNQREIASARAEAEYGRLLTALWAQDHLGIVVDGIVIEQTKGGLTILDSKRCCQLSVPYAELRHKSGSDEYKLGSPLTVQIYEAKVEKYPTVHASENLEKYSQIQNGNYELTADPKYYTPSAPAPSDSSNPDSPADFTAESDGSQMN